VTTARGGAPRRRAARRALRAAFASKDVAAVIRLRELRRAAVLQKPKSLDQQPRITLLGLEQLGLLSGEQHRTQALQRAHRAVAGALERGV
jgi:hypothetical protein